MYPDDIHVALATNVFASIGDLVDVATALAVATAKSGVPGGYNVWKQLGAPDRRLFPIRP